MPYAIALPHFSPTYLAIPSTLFTSWFAAVLAAHAGFEPAWDLYATAGPRARVMNMSRVVFVALAGATISGWVLGNTAMSFTSVAAQVGVALLGGAVLGHRLAWLAPTVYVLVIIGAGAFDPAGAAHSWAVASDPVPGSREFLVAASLLFLGAIAWWRSSSAQSSLHDRD